MGKYTQWIEHKGHRILFVDFSGIRDEVEYLGAFDEVEGEILSQPKGQKVLTLLDVSNSVLTRAITERAKRMTAAAKEAGIPDSPTAIVGMRGFQKAVVQAMQFFRQDIYIAESIEAGKDLLIAKM